MLLYCFLTHTHTQPNHSDSAPIPNSFRCLPGIWAVSGTPTQFLPTSLLLGKIAIPASSKWYHTPPGMQTESTKIFIPQTTAIEVVIWQLGNDSLSMAACGIARNWLLLTQSQEMPHLQHINSPAHDLPNRCGPVIRDRALVSSPRKYCEHCLWHKEGWSWAVVGGETWFAPSAHLSTHSREEKRGQQQ